MPCPYLRDCCSDKFLLSLLPFPSFVFTGLYGCQMLQRRHLHDIAVLFLFVVFDLILKWQLPSVIVMLTSINNVSKSNEHPWVFFTCHIFLRSILKSFFNEDIYKSNCMHLAYNFFLKYLSS